MLGGWFVQYLLPIRTLWLLQYTRFVSPLVLGSAALFVKCLGKMPLLPCACQFLTHLCRCRVQFLCIVWHHVWLWPSFCCLQFSIVKGGIHHGGKGCGLIVSIIMACCEKDLDRFSSGVM